MQDSRMLLSARQTQGMLERLRQGQALLTPLHRLGGKAETPQRLRGYIQAHHPIRHSVAGPLHPLLRQVDQGYALRAVRQGGTIVAQQTR